MTYTVTIINGDKAIPVGSQLAVTTSTNSPIKGNKCITSTPAGTVGDIALGGPLAQLQAANLVITCQFDVTVTNTHKLQGQINPINVTARFTNTGNDAAFHIPHASSDFVPVYTGASLSSLAVTPALSETKFYTGKCILEYGVPSKIAASCQPTISTKSLSYVAHLHFLELRAAWTQDATVKNHLC